jgi:5,5'-dehydrodivanillate O-demethylase oxygenase subunit
MAVRRRLRTRVAAVAPPGWANDSPAVVPSATVMPGGMSAQKTPLLAADSRRYLCRVLDDETNRRLTRVGAGTPMGELLRRYWQPIAAVSEFDNTPTRRLRLLGEDLVVYKDQSGTFGLVDAHCPHRRADMSYATVEPCGLRCSYHGWLFNERGECLEQPFEEVARSKARFREASRTKAYPVRARAGLLWAYLGPEPAPALPNWEPFTFQDVFVQIVFAELPCNWLQCQENSIDPIHFEWLHTNWSQAQRGVVEKRPTHVKIAFDEFEQGFVYRRMLEGTSEQDPLWTVGRVCLWPNALFTGALFGWRVPIDDENTLNVAWCWEAVPAHRRPYRQETIPSWVAPITDPKTGRWITSHVVNQDFAAWLGQGRITDRTKERLGESDRGIILLRKRLLEESEVALAGRDPKAVRRGAEEPIALPIVDRERLLAGDLGPKANMAPGQRPVGGFQGDVSDFIWLHGQPAEVRVLYRAAMGLDDVPP